MKIFCSIFIISFLLLSHTYSQEIKPENFKNDIKVNQNSGIIGAEQFAPNVTVNNDGNFLITWVDYRNGTSDSYFQMYNKEGKPIGENTVVDEPGNSSSYYGAASTFLPNGDFLIAWSSGGREIFVQKYNPLGEKIGHKIIVNNYVQFSSSSNYPHITSDNQGNFMVIWNSGIWKGRIFNSNCESVSEPFQLISGYYGGSIGSPGNIIAASDNGYFAIVWSGFKNPGDKSKIYLKLFDTTGAEASKDILISSINDTSYNYSPSIVKYINNSFIITWIAYKYTYSAAYSFTTAQIYSISDGLIGDNINVINRDTERWSQSNSACVMPDSNFIISWRNYNYISSKIYGKDGRCLIDSLDVKLDNPNAYPWFNSIASDSLGNYLYVWLDRRFGSTNVFYQRYDKDNNLLGNNVRVVSNAGSSWEINPHCALQNNGEMMIVWEDKREGYPQVYGQIFNYEGNPIGDNIKISSITNNYFYYELNPDVKIDKKGNYYVLWNLEHNIFLQKISRNGNLIDENIKIMENRYWYCNNVKITFNKSNNILVTWTADYNNNQTGLYGRKFKEDLTAYSDVITFISFTKNENTSPYGFTYSVNNDWHVCYSWHTNIGSSNNYKVSDEIYSQVISDDGINIGDVIQYSGLNELEEYTGVFLKSTTNSENDFIISWLTKTSDLNYSINLNYINADARSVKRTNIKIDSLWIPPNLVEMYSDNNSNILFLLSYQNKLIGQVTDNNLTKIRDKFTLVDFYNNKIAKNYYFYYKKGIIYYVWQDAREPGKGYDIYMNKTSILELDFPKKFPEYKLFNNYPNPFNSETIISYYLPNDSDAEIIVYNLLGEKVKKLLNERQQKGLHQIYFKSDGLPSGVYFVRLIAGQFTDTKKTILLK